MTNGRPSDGDESRRGSELDPRGSNAADSAEPESAADETRAPRARRGDGGPLIAIRRISRKAWSTLIVLGVTVSIGTFVVDRLIESGEDLLLDAVRVTVASHETSSYLFPATVRPADAPAEGAASDRFVAWAERSGGIPYGGIRVRLVLAGRDEAPVTVTRIRVRVQTREETRGSWVNLATECGGFVRKRVFRADLAQTPPRIDFYRNGKVQERPAFKVTAADPELFDVEITTGDQTYSLVIVADYSVEGRTGSAVVKHPSGEPFVLAGGGRPRVFKEVWRGQAGFVLERRRAELAADPGDLVPC